MSKDDEKTDATDEVPPLADAPAGEAPDGPVRFELASDYMARLEGRVAGLEAVGQNGMGPFSKINDVKFVNGQGEINRHLREGWVVMSTVIQEMNTRPGGAAQNQIRLEPVATMGRSVTDFDFSAADEAAEWQSQEAPVVNPETEPANYALTDQREAAPPMGSRRRPGPTRVNQAGSVGETKATGIRG